jgi:hypothetical protein
VAAMGWAPSLKEYPISPEHRAIKQQKDELIQFDKTLLTVPGFDLTAKGIDLDTALKSETTKRVGILWAEQEGDDDLIGGPGTLANGQGRRRLAGAGLLAIAPVGRALLLEGLEAVTVRAEPTEVLRRIVVVIAVLVIDVHLTQGQGQKSAERAGRHGLLRGAQGAPGDDMSLGHRSSPPAYKFYRG